MTLASVSSNQPKPGYLKASEAVLNDGLRNIENGMRGFIRGFFSGKIFKGFDLKNSHAYWSIMKEGSSSSYKKLLNRGNSDLKTFIFDKIMVGRYLVIGSLAATAIAALTSVFSQNGSKRKLVSNYIKVLGVCFFAAATAGFKYNVDSLFDMKNK